MRTLSNLYSIALEHYKTNKRYESAGLCHLTGNLLCENIFNSTEYTRISKSIRRNKPTKKLHKEHFFNYNDGMRHLYWWPVFTTHHRIAFLEHMVEYVKLPWYVKLWNKLK